MVADLTAPADAGAFLSRLTRLDPAALVRLRPAGETRLALWGVVPWGVLVTRTVAVDAAVCAQGERVVPAGELMASLPSQLALRVPDGLSRRDAEWRGSLPPAPSRAVEVLPTRTVRGLALAAADALRAVETTGLRGRAVGQRAVRDALLDHPVITGRSDVDGAPFVVAQKLVQATVRMGFLGNDDDPVTVVAAGLWTGLAAAFGTAWLRPAGALTVRPITNKTIG